MDRRLVLLGGLTAFLSGCGRWQVYYEAGLDPAVTRSWKLADVTVSVPDSLTVSNDNTYAPNADIVWHGEPFGDRRAQVATIMEEGIRQGGAALPGTRNVTIVAQVQHFHAVTPAAVARAPGAVHNIAYRVRVFDAQTAEPLTQAQSIEADLEAYVGDAAILAEIQGQTQRVRIVDHIAKVTAGWLGVGFDQRRVFESVGR